MLPATLQAFIVEVESDAAAAALVDPTAKAADVSWQFHSALKKLCKKFSNRQNLLINTVVDQATVALNGHSAKLNQARADATATVVASNTAAVEAALANIVVPE